MNSLAEAPSGWSRGNFWLVVTAIFVGQVAWIMLLGERGHTPPPPVAARGVLRFLDTPLTDEKWDEEVFAVDPTIFPGAGDRGFSGLAWKQLPSREGSDPLPKPAPAFLEYAAHPPAAPTAPEPSPLLQIPFPASLQPDAVATSAGNLPEARPRSFFRVGDALAGRQIAPPSALPGWTAETADDLVGNTIVQFGVNRAGEVIDESLAGSSGLDAADASALQSVKGFRFRPLPRRAAVETWHTATFYWETLPFSTNSPK